MSDDRQVGGVVQVERYPDGKIPASRRYLDYSGQVIIRTRYATIQRWKDEGAGGGRARRIAPIILNETYCTGEGDVLEVRNDELEENQFSVYYVDDSETVDYEVLS